jgi:phosphoglycerate dehydrogenase-like enzyme
VSGERWTPGPEPGRERPCVLAQLSRERYEQIFAPEARRRLHDLAEVIGPFDTPAAAAAAMTHLSAADVLFMGARPQGAGLDRDALARAGRLRWIADTSGGPRPMDYPTAFARGILLTDCRRAFSRSVAEMALALYLAVMRDVVVHDRALHTAAAVEGVEKSRNRDASFRTLGFVGFGGIAQMLARFLAPFEPRLLAYDPFVPAGVLAGFRAAPVALPELFRSSDAVFVMAMPGPDNVNLVGAAELDLLRPESVLLVISRSALVDEAALLERLRAGKFRAAMDVFDVEPLPAEHPYRSLTNVVLTPHRAGGTREAYWRIGQGLVDDLERFLAGAPPAHNAVVDEATARRLHLM